VTVVAHRLRGSDSIPGPIEKSFNLFSPGGMGGYIGKGVRGVSTAVGGGNGDFLHVQHLLTVLEIVLISHRDYFEVVALFFRKCSASVTRSGDTDTLSS